MSATLTPPKEQARRSTGSGTGDAWRVIVLNDDHNSFEGVAFALASDADRCASPAVEMTLVDVVAK